MDYIKYVEDIERRLDPDVEDALYQDWTIFLEDKWEGEYFAPRRPEQPAPDLEWPEININDALQDNTLMLIDQLSVCSKLLQMGSGNMLQMRSNYGIGILPSLYGVKRFYMPYETNTLPNVYPLEGGIDDIKEIIDNGIPSLDNGWGEKVFRFGEMMLDIKSKYPKIAKYIRIDHPDCQGPMDVSELLWGSEIFYDLYDRSDLVHQLLRNVTDTYKAFLDKWFKLCPNQDPYHGYFGALHRGYITVRDDSAMNLSPDMFDKFIYKYDEEILTHFGGGSMHYCGRGEHFIERTVGMEGLNAVNLGQPELNDMEQVFANTIDKGVHIFKLDKPTADEAISRGRRLHGLVHVDELI